MDTELMEILKNAILLEDLKSISKLNEDQRTACCDLTPDQQWVMFLCLSSAADGDFAAAANQFYNGSEQKGLNPSMKDFFVLYELKDFSEFCDLALKSITSVKNPDAELSVEEILAALASPKEETRNEAPASPKEESRNEALAVSKEESRNEAPASPKEESRNEAPTPPKEESRDEALAVSKDEIRNETSQADS